MFKSHLPRVTLCVSLPCSFVFLKEAKYYHTLDKPILYLSTDKGHEQNSEYISRIYHLNCLFSLLL